MTQTNVIAGALAIAFIIFISARGELDDYLALFKMRKVEAEGSPQTEDGGDSKGGLGGWLDGLIDKGKDTLINKGKNYLEDTVWDFYERHTQDSRSV